MELKDTVNGMLSKDYKERFVAENYNCGGTLEHDCPLALLRDQQKYMSICHFCMTEYCQTTALIGNIHCMERFC